MAKTVAVVGTYRAGASLIASVLHNLGVDMGHPFQGCCYEPPDLSASLQRWWQEPQFVAKESAANRVYRLKQWLDSRTSNEWIGAKHPLLTLSMADVERAWGKSTKFIWCHRSLADSIKSLKQAGCCPNASQLQQKLYSVADSQFPRSNGLVLSFDDSLTRVEWALQQLIDFLGIQPTEDQKATALLVARQTIEEKYKKPSEKSSLASSAVPCTGRGGIVATMICGNSGAIVEQAVESVRNYIDRLVFIDTGCNDESLTIARRLMENRLVVREFTWNDDVGAARNYALKCAAELNAAWALTIDTDERLLFEGLGSKGELLSQLDSLANVQAWMVDAASGAYSKERFIRIPTSLNWQGRCHEAFSVDSEANRRRLRQVRFLEVAKSQAEFHKKLKQDLKLLREDLASNPACGRGWYYLGETLVGLKLPDDAIAAFDRCATSRASDQLSAWACYRSAKCLSDSGRYDEAIERCAIGLAIDPEFPELAWMSAWCSLQLNRNERAIAWAKMAAALGAELNPESLDRRMWFRDLIGWYEGPLEVMTVAYQRLGHAKSMRSYKKALMAARAAREIVVGNRKSNADSV